jgi:two-component system, LuxR family, response regulator FixJ
MTRPAVYIVDDQPAICVGLSEMLNGFGYEVETFTSARDFLVRAEDLRPGCLVAEVRMPEMGGIDLLLELERRCIRIPVVLISAFADVPTAIKAIKAGAEDLIEKPINAAQLISAINQCLARVVERLTDRHSSDEVQRRFRLLTPREAEVFDLVAQGCTSHSIAGRLHISTRTVESYRVQIMDKMQAESVTVLVRQAIRLGRISA